MIFQGSPAYYNYYLIITDVPMLLERIFMMLYKAQQ